MLRRGRAEVVTCAALVVAACVVCFAQQQQTKPPGPPSTPAAQEEQEPERVYTEEVLLPVAAFDDKGRFDPTLAPADVLVLEDGAAQQVRSVRRVAANVLLVFDLGGGQITDTGSAETTREVALRLFAGMREGDEAAVVQGGRRTEVLAGWTGDRDALAQVVRTQLFSGSRSRLSACLTAAADLSRQKPVGNTHVVIFTDGVEPQADPKAFDEAVARVASTQATTHVVAFSSLARKSVRAHNGNVFDLDFEMKRSRKKYAEATRRNDERLARLVAEVGGRLLVPETRDEAERLAGEVARDIGAQYVVSYTPKRPFVGGGERRGVKVFSRRVGLQLVSMRGYVTPAVRTP